jgi:hypothetical protein
MLKKKLNAVIIGAALFAGSAVIPAVAQENGQTIQGDSMMGSKMKDDKMKDDKMAGARMSGPKTRKHRRSRKHKTGSKMAADKM